MHINEEFCHSHEHVHTNPDGTTYTHSHDHKHDEHHAADHVHTHANDQGEKDKTKALLTYMLHHNEHHAEELAGMLDSLPEAARAKLSLAIGTFEAANVELKEVLDCLE